MHRIALAAALLALSLSFAAAPARAAEDAAAQWPAFRGPDGNGVAPLADPPVEWSESKNVAWKAELPGKGHSSPVVWGDTVFVTVAAATERVDDSKAGDGGDSPHGRRGPPSLKADRVYSFDLVAYARADGSVKWRRSTTEDQPSDRVHPDGSWASNSPVTDGTLVFAYFGSRGLTCFDMAGERKWRLDLGPMVKKMSFGEGSSPVLAGDRLLVLRDQEGPSALLCLDKTSGKELWRAERDEASTWSTPLVVEAGGRKQVVTNATRRIRAYDLETGALLWECAGMTQNVIPSPVAADGLVFCLSGFRGNAGVAVRLDGAEGDVTGTAALAWTLDRDMPYTPSPLLMGGNLYFLKGNGAILSCADAKTGKVHYGGERFQNLGTVYASPVGARDRFYVTGKKGVTLVLGHGPACVVLAENALDDAFTATPALAGADLFLRGEKSLYCIRGK